jgi:hypothetical protein
MNIGGTEGEVRIMLASKITLEYFGKKKTVE